MLRLQAYHCARMQRASGIGLVKPCLIGDLMPESELVEEINNVCISYFGADYPTSVISTHRRQQRATLWKKFRNAPNFMCTSAVMVIVVVVC